MRGLLKDVSMDELRAMRDSGMTNMDISERLGVSYQTIYKHLGPQPSRGGLVAKYIPESRISAVEQAPKSKPVLPVVSRVLCLAGGVAEYTVDTQSKTVTVTVGGEPFEILFDQWSNFAEEVAAIDRNLSGLDVGPDFW